MMKNKIISIFVCMLMSTTVISAISILNNYELNETDNLHKSKYYNSFPCHDCEDSETIREPRIKERRIPTKKTIEQTKQKTYNYVKENVSD